MPLPPNERFFDRFSVVHAAWGAVFQLSGVPAPLAIGAQVGFEIVENGIKRAYAPMFPDDAPDAIQNQIGDVASFTAGYYLTRLAKDQPGGRFALLFLGALSGAIWLDRLAARPALPRRREE